MAGVMLLRRQSWLALKLRHRLRWAPILTPPHPQPLPWKGKESPREFLKEEKYENRAGLEQTLNSMRVWGFKATSLLLNCSISERRWRPRKASSRTISYWLVCGKCCFRFDIFRPRRGVLTAKLCKLACGKWIGGGSKWGRVMIKAAIKPSCLTSLLWYLVQKPQAP